MNVLHARGVNAEGDVQIASRNRTVVLGDVLLCVRVAKSAQLRKDRGDLIPGQFRTAAEGHVFLGVCHARKTLRSFVTAHQIVLLHRDHRCEGDAQNDDAHAIVQGRAGDVAGLARRSSLSKQQNRSQ